ncbi:eCIS core domain-containing protein [Cohnella algarum]|uniref:eCIS core domain-containing protein n=1 Tax=Cohnella algarum TaxID=2044859 RepID=UPI0019689F67|nr:DUF4157 domain-containing protein [Cohnella algarum]MBN2982756.1 DUF4157 domain-containing protein [Cohnella algarum]
MERSRTFRNGDKAVSSPYSGLGKASPSPLQRRAASPPDRLLAMQRLSVQGNQASLQRLRDGAHEAATAAAPLQRKTGPGGMPAEVLAKMEAAFGADFSDVAIHPNSASATQAGALAYAQGTDIHFAPGQYAPHSRDGQRMLGHELAHVLQQKAGRVVPTGATASGVPLNDDPALEREADELGAKAADADVPAAGAIQRVAGSEAAARTAGGAGAQPIQRLPSKQDVIGELGPPKEHVKNKVAGTRVGRFFKMKENLKENSTRYRGVLDKIEAFDRYVDGTVLGEAPGEMDDQLEHVMSLYATVENAAEQYIADKKADKKTAYMRRLKRAIPMEKLAVQSTVEEHKRHPEMKKPKWKLITSASPFKTVQLDNAMATGAVDRGNLNSVSFFESGIGDEGVFKETKDVILTGDELPPTASEAEFNKAEDEAWVARDHAGIDLKSARLAERNVAMSRLDQLLGAGVIARTEFALRNTGTEIQKGTFMLKAQGKQAGSLMKGGQLAEGASGPGQEGGLPAIDLHDSNLQRCLSRLQLIDALAMQVDRHFGNFFIQFDESGRVLGVTGIDNDMAFGKIKTVAKGRKEFPGISRFVDKELAERILALRDEELVAVMEDLLSPEEMDALLSRLHGLQEHLKQEKTRLLDPDEWNDATAKGMLDEHKSFDNDHSSYYGRMKEAVG